MSGIAKAYIYLSEESFITLRNHLRNHLPPEQGGLRATFELLPFSVPSKTIICHLRQDILLVLNE